MSLRYDLKHFRAVETTYDHPGYMDHRCASDSDPSEAPSDDSDHSSGAPARRFRASQKSNRSRNNKLRTLNRWTAEEHDKLAYLVDKWGSEKNWAKVAEEMPGRTGKQCRERWLNHMKPGIIKGNWSADEEFLLAQCHAIVGSHWSKMTKRLPGRTENSIKNFWNATLRSKAPNKKRGMLWTYMQLHDPKSDDNTPALIATVNRLHETRELPQHLLAQLDAQLLDSRTWKLIHKAEKEYLENVGGELHQLSLPHPLVSSIVGTLQGYGAAGTVVPTAASPVASVLPHHTYSHAVLPSRAFSQSGDVKVEQGMMIGQGMLPDVPSSNVAGPAGTMGLEHYLLTAQDPMLGCGTDMYNQDLLRVLGSTGNQHPRSLMDVHPNNQANNGAADAATADFTMYPPSSQLLAGGNESSGATCVAAASEQAPHPSESACTLQMSLSLERQASTLTSNIARDSGRQMAPSYQLNPAAEPAGGQDSVLKHAAGRVSDQQAAVGEPGRQQQYNSSGRQYQHESLGDYVAGSLEDTYHGSRAHGGHGPHCSCGPCSNSRRLHGLHSPAARRNARLNSTTGLRYQQAAAPLAAGSGTGQLNLQQTQQLQQQPLPADTEAVTSAGCVVVAQDHAIQHQYISNTSQYPEQCHPGLYNTCQSLPQHQHAHHYSMAPQEQETYAQQAVVNQLAPIQHQPTGLSSAAVASVDEVQNPAASVTGDDLASMQAGSMVRPSWHSCNMQQEQPGLRQGQQMPVSETIPQCQQQQSAANAGQLEGVKSGPAHLTLPGLSPDALTGLLFSPLGLLSPLGGFLMPTSTRPFRLPSFGQISLMRPSLNGSDWDWEALMSSDNTQQARAVHTGGDHECAADKNRVGNKRPRGSFLNAEDDAALLIDMQPTKTARTVDANATSLTGGNNPYLKDFLDKFE